MAWPELPGRGNSIYKNLEVRERNERVIDLGLLEGAVSTEWPGSSCLSREKFRPRPRLPRRGGL